MAERLGDAAGQRRRLGPVPRDLGGGGERGAREDAVDMLVPGRRIAGQRRRLPRTVMIENSWLNSTNPSRIAGRSPISAQAASASAASRMRTWPLPS
jgi:hypothetical protein